MFNFIRERKEMTVMPGKLVTRDPRDLLALRDFAVTGVQVDPMDEMEEMVTPEMLDPQAFL